MTDKSLNADKLDVIPSIGNVFEDLGFDEPELELAKARLALAIAQVIEERHLTQTEAGNITGLDQPRVSSIMRGRLGGFSIERLFRTLVALGQDVDITVRSSQHVDRARLTVRVDPINV